MVTIQIYEQTANALEVQAQKAGISLSEYLRTLVDTQGITSRPTWDELEHEINALSSSEPSLPENFSRADIYHDHN